MRDVLLTGKVYEAVRRRKGSEHVYDAVARRAPDEADHPFLGVNEEVAGLARVGPIRTQTDSIMSLLHGR